MEKLNNNITFEIVLKSLKNDFDPEQREIIFEILKNNDFEEDELAGAKLLLEEYNWDYEVVYQIIEELHSKIDDIEVEHRKSNFNFIKYAAILIPFFAIIGYYLVNKSNDINTYYIKEKGLPNLMANENKTNWNSVMEPYKKRDFLKAYENVIKLSETKRKNDTVAYFKSVIAFELKDYEVANTSFQEVLTFKNSAFIYDAEFRLGFSLYNSGRKNEAKKIFQKIHSEKDNPFQSEAGEIISSFF